MILVTGASGTVGSALVRALLSRGEQVTALTRDPAKIRPRPGLTVATEIVKADAIFLLAPPGPDIPALEGAMLAAATAAEIPRVVKLSAIGTGSFGTPSSDWHLPGETAVRRSGRSWTILRPSTFASNALAWAPDVRAGRPIPNLFGDGRQGVVDPADVAEVAAEVLTRPGHDERVYTLTGPELLSVPEQAGILARVLGVPVDTRHVPLAEARVYFPPELAESALAGAALVREGGNAVLTPDVAGVLGRAPRSFEAWAASAREQF